MFLFKRHLMMSLLLLLISLKLKVLLLQRFCFKYVKIWIEVFGLWPFCRLEQKKCLRCLFLLDLKCSCNRHHTLNSRFTETLILIALITVWDCPSCLTCDHFFCAAFTAPVGVSLWDSAGSLLSDIQTPSACYLTYLHCYCGGDWCICYECRIGEVL